MKTGLLVMAYGSPVEYTFEGVAEFYTNIRDGKRPSKEEIETLYEKYKRIGASPLQKITRDTVEKLKKHLGEEFELYYANKFSSPRIDEVIKQMEEEGIKRCLCLILEPYYSMYSVMGYERFIKSQHISFHIIPSWNLEEGLLAYWSEEISKKVKRDERKKL